MQRFIRSAVRSVIALAVGAVALGLPTPSPAGATQVSEAGLALVLAGGATYTPGFALTSTASVVQHFTITGTGAGAAEGASVPTAAQVKVGVGTASCTFTGATDLGGETFALGLGSVSGSCVFSAPVTLPPGSGAVAMSMTARYVRVGTTMVMTGSCVFPWGGGTGRIFAAALELVPTSVGTTVTTLAAAGTVDCLPDASGIQP
jgi:hypothetical protein